MSFVKTTDIHTDSRRDGRHFKEGVCGTTTPTGAHAAVLPLTVHLLCRPGSTAISQLRLCVHSPVVSVAYTGAVQATLTHYVSCPDHFKKMIRAADLHVAPPINLPLTIDPSTHTHVHSRCAWKRTRSL